MQEVKERTKLWINEYNELCLQNSLNGMRSVEYRLFFQPQNSGNTWFCLGDVYSFFFEIHADQSRHERRAVEIQPCFFLGHVE